jgi:hypothetical protein
VTLDSLERLSVDMLAVADQHGQDNRLARAVLAMLPVVRAAEELRVVHDADELVANREIQLRCDCALCTAISAMRTAIGEKL